MNPLIDQGLATGLIAFDTEQKNIVYKTPNKRLRYTNCVLISIRFFMRRSMDFIQRNFMCLRALR